MKVLLVGLPESGKSTYIGALSHLLTAGRHQTQIRFAGLTDAEAHNSALEERWLACESVGRTRLKSQQEGIFDIFVGDTRAVLSLPDLSGEAFRQPAAHGQCRIELFNSLVAADGIVLFTNANRAKDDRLLFDAVREYAELQDAFAAELADAGLPVDNIADGEADLGEEERTGTPFNPDEMPEEVLLVELLQQINRKPLKSRRRAIAVVVSAWDVVASATDPAEWWSAHRPMLAQFLRHNPHQWDVKIWGISAQGGDLPRDAERLRDFKDPAQRIQVVGDCQSRHDLSAPIAWLVSDAIPAFQ